MLVVHLSCYITFVQILCFTTMDAILKNMHWIQYERIWLQLQPGLRPLTLSWTKCILRGIQIPGATITAIHITSESLIRWAPTFIIAWIWRFTCYIFLLPCRLILKFVSKPFPGCLGTVELHVIWTGNIFFSTYCTYLISTIGSFIVERLFQYL